jgi:hypothetical protein
MLHQRPIYAISDGLYDPGSGGISGEGPPTAFRTVVLGMPFFCFHTNEQSPAVCNVPGSPCDHLAGYLVEFLRDCDGKAMARGMD